MAHVNASHCQKVPSQDGELTSSWSMSQSPVMTIRFSILVSDRPPFSVCRQETGAVMEAAWHRRNNSKCVLAAVSTLVMCVVVVVHRDSDVIVWAVIKTPGSVSPLPSNLEKKRQQDQQLDLITGVTTEFPPGGGGCKPACTGTRKEAYLLQKTP